MLPLQSIESPALGHTADENRETRLQKPKILPCRYCSKRFRRVEHVQRHERTHTKEKPFSCGWAHCGKTFGRRDLLVRHEKLVHLNQGSKDGPRPRKPSSGTAVPVPLPGPSHDHMDAEMLGLQPQPRPPQYQPNGMQPPEAASLPPDPRLPSRAPACNLDLLSDAATHIASGGHVNAMQPTMMPGLGPPVHDMARIKQPFEVAMPYADRARESDAGIMTAGYPGQAGHPAQASFDDYTLFLDDYTTSSHFLPPSLEAEQSLGMWSRPVPAMATRGPSKPSSTFTSRFSSLQPDARDAHEGGAAARTHEDSVRAPNWRISAMEHSVIKTRLDEFSPILPNDFVFPSRHTLTRFLDGYIHGFHEHLPFLHMPTFSPTDVSPELLLAMLAMGAQSRFETNRGHALWYAAKAVALEQIRRRHSHEVYGLLPTPTAYSPHSTRPSPSSGFRHSFTGVHQDRPMTQDTHREPYSPNTSQSRLETIQALLVLFAVGLWGAKAILHEALSLQSLLALLVREEGLFVKSNQAVEWETWVRLEASTRTKLIAYCFFNLASIAYNTPPLLLTWEVDVYLPNPSRLWRAENGWQWQEARQSYTNMDMSLQDAFSRLLHRPSQGPPSPVTSLGNYVLVHALIQHIFLLKQTSFTSLSPFDLHRRLKVEDVEEVSQALRVWTMGMEENRQLRVSETGQPANGADTLTDEPIAFNSTALLRLAYIRLHTELNPSRSLETRDTMQIAAALSHAPLLMRTWRLGRAVIQAIHALSMLVKVGVNYVARTKSLEWSIQHSLCNFECAVLLSKWLMTLASIGPGDPRPSVEEKNLLEMVRRMLDETEFAVPIDPSLSGPGGAAAAAAASHHHDQDHAGVRPLLETSVASDSNKLRQLAAAVIRLWAETFKGTHMFEIVRIMGAGLEGYADLIEKPHDQTPMGRMSSNADMA